MNPLMKSKLDADRLQSLRQLERDGERIGSNARIPRQGYTPRSEVLLTNAITLVRCEWKVVAITPELFTSLC